MSKLVLEAVDANIIQASPWMKRAARLREEKALYALSWRGMRAALLAPWKGRDGWWQFLGTDTRIGADGLRLLVRELMDPAEECGRFTALLSPLSTKDKLKMYSRAGFFQLQEITAYRSFLRSSLGSRDGAAPGSLCLWGPERIADILTIDENSFSSFWRTTASDLKLDLASQICLGWELSGEPVAYAMLAPQKEWGTVARLAVVKEHRRKKIGSALLRASLTKLGEKGCDGAFVATQSDNAASNKLYLKAGMIPSHTPFFIRGYPWKPNDPSWGLYG